MSDGPIRLAVIGDSVMWGQGLDRDDVFATAAAERIAESLDRPVDVVRFTARSGAKIEASDADLEHFADTYPNLMTRGGPDGDDPERAAYHLYGDVPCSLPSIRHQLDTLVETTDQVDLLILDGGANDAAFAELLDPRGSDAFVDRLDPMLEETVYRRLGDLLTAARQEFPRTTIVVTGYFPGFSDDTDRHDLEELVEYFAERELGWLQANGLLFLAKVLAFVAGKDVLDDALDRAQAQAEYAHSRVLYWQRRAVSECNRDAGDDPVDDPVPASGGPVLFVHPTFGDRNAVFAPESFIHEEYTLTGVEDDLAERRFEACPRSDQVDTMRALASALRNVDDARSVQRVRDLTDTLLAEIDGPTSLRTALGELFERGTSWADWLHAQSLLVQEIGRIETCRIASFIHPNPAGAERYTERIVERWSDSGDNRSGDPELAVIDSISVRIHTADDSDEPIREALELDLGAGHRWLLDHYTHRRSPHVGGSGLHFRPGTIDRFTIDPLGVLRYDDIRYLEIIRGPAPFGGDERAGRWRPQRVWLELNGITVFQSNVLDRDVLAGRRLVLPFPSIEEVGVPDVIGMDHAEAVEVLEQTGLFGGKGGGEFSEDIPRGQISSQRPSAHERVARGSRVALKASRGPRPVEPDPTTVPDVVGLREEEATAALGSIGFATSLSFAPSERPFGIVISQSPSAGTNVQPGATVALIASRGSGPIK